MFTWGDRLSGTSLTMGSGWLSAFTSWFDSATGYQLGSKMLSVLRKDASLLATSAEGAGFLSGQGRVLQTGAGGRAELPAVLPSQQSEAVLGLPTGRLP